jgi:hypothetical protein
MPPEPSSDLIRDESPAVVHVVVGEAQHELTGQLQRVRRGPVGLERTPRAVSAPAVDLDHEALLRPMEVDAVLAEHALRDRARDAVPAQEIQEAVFEIGLRRSAVTIHAPQHCRRATRERICERVPPEQAAVLGLSLRALDHPRWQHVSEVGERASDRARWDPHDDRAIRTGEDGAMGRDPAMGPLISRGDVRAGSIV